MRQRLWRENSIGNVDRPTTFVLWVYFYFMKIKARVSTDTSELEAYLKARVAATRSKAIKALAEAARKAYADDVMGTWHTHYPIDVDVDERAGTADVSVIGEVPFFLNVGTRVRYATMTPDFSPKTSPRVLRSGSGSGGLAYVNVNKPNPGIEKREFDKSVADEVSTQAPEIIIRAWNSS